MGNDAFKNDPYELVRIFRDLADKIERNGGVDDDFSGFVAMDALGNSVGKLEILHDNPEFSPTQG